MFFSSLFLYMFSPSSDINPCHSLFFDRDHLRFNLGIICGLGSFAVLGSFADPYSAHPVFGRSWVRFLSGTQNFPLSHARVMLINLPSMFLFLHKTETTWQILNQIADYLDKQCLYNSYTNAILDNNVYLQLVVVFR